MESPQRDPRVGVVLNGRYRITELLGEGGMGLVYRGERVQLGRPVAIKFLHLSYAKSPRFVARFEREARAMSLLSHPYCVSVIDFGVHDEPYIVMDFVTGETLRDLMDRERIAPPRAVQISRQILAGLAHAHEQGVIHRDIKPGNVMIGEATAMGDHVRIFDFGLAKLHDTTLEGDHSMATVIGTPAYMAPEQTRAEPIDARADLYAVGILLFEMLTGDKPFTGEDAYEVIRKQRDEPPPALAERAPGVSSELEQVVRKALEKDPNQRYQSATEFLAGLDAVPEAFVRASSVTSDTGPVPASAARRGDASSGSGSRSQPGASSSGAAQPDAPRVGLWPLLGLGLVTAVGVIAYVTTRSGSEPDPIPAPQAVPIPAPEAVAPSLDAAAVVSERAAEPSPAESAPDAAASALELSSEQLAEADQALDRTAEQEFTPPSAGPEVKSVSDVHRLLAQKELDAAIYGLHVLRAKSPYNPYYPYLLGDLYFERGYFGDGLAKYREAIRLSDGYKKRASIHANALRALAHDATYARALVLLERDVGEAALPALREAASGADEPALKARAQHALERLAR